MKSEREEAEKVRPAIHRFAFILLLPLHAHAMVAASFPSGLAVTRGGCVLTNERWDVSIAGWMALQSLFLTA